MSILQYSEASNSGFNKMKPEGCFANPSEGTSNLYFLTLLYVNALFMNAPRGECRKPLTIITKRSILDLVAVLDAPLVPFPNFELAKILFWLRKVS